MRSKKHYKNISLLLAVIILALTFNVGFLQTAAESTNGGNVIFEDDFNRENGSVGNGWTTGAGAYLSIVSNTANLSTNRQYFNWQNYGKAYVTEKAVMRPSSEATLNQNISAEFKSLSTAENCETGMYASQGGALIARCQGVTATNDNCYRLYVQLGTGGGADKKGYVYLYNTASEIYKSEISVASNISYRLELNVVSLSGSRTRLDINMYLLDEEGNVTETLINAAVVDNDTKLQKAGTVGFSSCDFWGNGPNTGVVGVDNFKYTEIDTEASEEGDYEIKTFEDDFNRENGSIHNNNGWYSQCEVLSPAGEHSIENGYLLVEDYSGGDGARTSFSSRTSAEAGVNQRVSADILNLNEGIIAGVHVRFTHPDNYSTGPDYSYMARVTNQEISILRVNTAWGADVTALENGGEKTQYDFNENHTYRIELTAEGTLPTKLSATLYDVTAGGVSVAAVSGTDSTLDFQNVGRVALSSTKSSNGRVAVKFDNFKYEYIKDESFESTNVTNCEDSFDRADGDIGNNWVKGLRSVAQISSNSLKLKTNRSDGGSAAYISETAVLRPMSEASLDQTVSADFQSGVGLRENQGGALIARCQGSVATDSNCYRLYARLGFNGGGNWLSNIGLYNSQGEQIFITDKYMSSDQKYRLQLQVTSISETETRLDIKMLALDANGNVTGTYVDTSVVDDDPNLQTEGTAGVSIYDTSAATINIDNFKYTSSKMFSFNDKKPVAFKIFEAENEKNYLKNYTVSNVDGATDTRAALDSKNSKAVDYNDLCVNLGRNSGYVAFTIYAEMEGEYKVRLRYKFGCDNQAEFDEFAEQNGKPYASVIVNGEAAYKFTNSADRGEFGTTEDVLLSLNEGVNIIYCMSPTLELTEALGGAYIDYDSLFISGEIDKAEGDIVISGDANGDKSVDVRDIVKLKRFLSGLNEEINESAADLTLDSGDRLVDALDLSRLKKYILLSDTETDEFNDLNWLRFSRIIDPEKAEMFKNTYYKLKTEKELTVAYFGGSITYGTGATDANLYSWRARTTSWLKKKFPNATINETNAAIGGTGTAFGIYRAISDLKLDSETEKPDFVFLEFAINDLYDGIDTATAKANMEYIIRTIYEFVPDADIFVILTTDQAQMNKEFDMLKAHRDVAEAYNLPYLTVGKRIWNHMLAENNGSYPTAEIYSKYFSDTVHPANAGHEKYAEYITEFLSDVFFAKASVPQSSVNAEVPSETLSQLPISPYAANFKGQTPPTGTTIDKDGHIISNTAGTTFKFEFKGTDLKAWVWATLDGGSLSVSVDGAAPVELQLYTDYTNHKIKTIASGLQNTTHTVTVTLNGSSRGSKMEIWNFLISGSNEKSGVNLIN